MSTPASPESQTKGLTEGIASVVEHGFGVERGLFDADSLEELVLATREHFQPSVVSSEISYGIDSLAFSTNGNRVALLSKTAAWLASAAQPVMLTLSDYVRAQAVSHNATDLLYWSPNRVELTTAQTNRFVPAALYSASRSRGVLARVCAGAEVLTIEQEEALTLEPGDVSFFATEDLIIREMLSGRLAKRQVEFERPKSASGLSVNFVQALPV